MSSRSGERIKKVPAGAVAHRELVRAVVRAVRNISAKGALLRQEYAEKVGLHGTDLDCLSVLADAGGMPAGRLVEVTGLTSGAVTRLVDRLEQAGYVRREADSEDRRRVIVQPVPERMAALAPFFEEMERHMTERFSHYQPKELEFLLEFLEGGQRMMQEQVHHSRTGEAPDAVTGGSASAPLGDVAQGTLVFAAGAADVSLRADQLATDLYRARFEGAHPTVRVRDGKVTIEYKRFSFGEWAKRALGAAGPLSANVTLNAAIPWSIELRQGASQVEARLGGLTLSALDIRGGASEIDLALPAPKGTVPISLTGGASHVTLRCPPGVAYRVTLSGGASHLKLGAQSFGGIGGTLHWETPDYGKAADRVDLSISGGASHLTVGT